MHAHRPAIAVLFTLSLFACGGIVTSSTQNQPAEGSPAGTPSSTQTQTPPSNSTGAPSPAGTGGPPMAALACPATVPADGAPCTSQPSNCEYGGSGPADLCSTTASCYGDTQSSPTTWHLTLPDPACVATPAQNASACPATLDALMNGAACPLVGDCVYPDGLCGCTSCFDASNSGKTRQWTCVAYGTAPAGCPSARPERGSACAVESQHCEYGAPCEALLDWNPMTCTNGAWTVDPHGEDCSQPACK